MISQLPRLLLVTDVPVARGHLGSSEALYRLFSDYPPDLLTIVQTHGVLPDAALRLPGRSYLHKPAPFHHLAAQGLQGRSLPGRLRAGLGKLAKLGHAAFGGRRWRTEAWATGAEAIVTLCHGNGWLLATRLARDLGLPLHLIVHDGPAYFQLTRPVFGPILTRVFIAACRQARTRWAISPELEGYLAALSGVPGEVMLPFRDAEDLVPAPAPHSPNRRHAVYFGGLTSASVLGQLQKMGAAMKKRDRELRVYGMVTAHIAARPDWAARPFAFEGRFADRDAFLQDCRRTAAFLYLPFPFDEPDMAFSFPSKLVDYALAGLPVLVQAPPDTPLGRWCRARPNCVAYVDSPDLESLLPVLDRLLDEPASGRVLANSLLAAAAQDFEPAVSIARFHHALASAPSSNWTQAQA